jgi:hypothetical protein
MYGETVGFAVAPSVALAYATVAAFLFALSRMPADGPALAAQPGAVPPSHLRPGHGMRPRCASRPFPASMKTFNDVK